ncbi:MAG: peptide chain release factor N(5)-glutamine methyltransferase [Acidimicrobiales bacterium]
MDARPALVDELVGAGLARREARWLVEELLVGDDDAARGAFDAAVRRRLAGEPLQYVLGHWPFRGLDLDLDERVLIPRPESEEVVGHALAALARGDAASPRVVDLGCGSGAIGLAIVTELARRGVTATLVGVDRSAGALAVARRNARKHAVTGATFVRSSWFADLDPSLRGRVDVVVANPPYVGAEELARLDPVLAYEPREALVAPDEGGVAGFADVSHVIRAAPPWLTSGGHLVVEHGESQGGAAVEVARAAGLVEVVDHADVAGRPRVLTARRP